MAHSSPHKVIFHCCSIKKENSKGNTYQVDCALAEPVPCLCKTWCIPTVQLQHQMVVEDKMFYDNVPSYFPYIQH